MNEYRDSPGDRVTFGTSNRLKLGLFGANMQSQTALTAVPERWQANWRDNVEVAELADEAGIEFLLPVMRWKGYGGKVDPAGVCLESIVWATGLLAKTKKITIFATVHAPLINPVFAAKQFATADQIGEGRFAVNIVVGWNEDEFLMFGSDSKPEERYPYARDWINCIKEIWAHDDEEFDFDGHFLKLRGLRAKPQPYGGTRPMLVNAGMSEIGKAYAVDCCDGWFSTPPKGTSFADIIADAKARTRSKGATYPVLTSATIFCRPTQKEADEYYSYCMENADWDAVDKMLDVRSRSGRNMPQGDVWARRKEMIKGLGDFRLVGDPDRIANEFAKLHAEGVDGIAMVFINQKEQVPYFLQEVMPRLKKMGLRS